MNNHAALIRKQMDQLELSLGQALDILQAPNLSDGYARWAATQKLLGKSASAESFRKQFPGVAVESDAFLDSGKGFWDMVFEANPHIVESFRNIQEQL